MGIMSKETVNAGAEYNTIAAGTKITGDVVADASFRLDGQINGTLTCKGKVIIGANGSMEGTLTCANAELLGKFSGKIVVSDTLSLRSSAVVDGEIKTKVLSVEPNAKFTGTCDMSAAQAQPNQQIKK